MEIKREFSARYHSHHALKTPAHITLFPPFRWPHACVTEFACLEEFCRVKTPVSIDIKDFGAFSPRVIFVKPILSKLLKETYAELQDFLKTRLDLVDPMAKRRAFTPHITVAHRDLTPTAFKAAWSEFRERSLSASFTARHLTLLQHDGRRWTTARQWLFESQPGLHLG